MKKLFLLIPIILSITLLSLSFAPASATSTEGIDMSYDKDTGNITYTWDFPDTQYRMFCQSYTEITFLGGMYPHAPDTRISESIQFYGFDKHNTLLYKDEYTMLENSSGIIPCSGSFVINVNDYVPPTPYFVSRTTEINVSMKFYDRVTQWGVNSKNGFEYTVLEELIFKLDDTKRLESLECGESTSVANQNILAYDTETMGKLHRIDWVTCQTETHTFAEWQAIAEKKARETMPPLCRIVGWIVICS